MREVCWAGVRMIPALVPPQGQLQELVHGPVPTDQIVRVADGDLVYGVSSVGDGGRIADKHLLSALGCRPSIRLEVAVTETGALLLCPGAAGTVIVTSNGHIRLPYRQRRRVCLFVGDRVLLLGRSSTARLLVYPPAAIGELLAAALPMLAAVSA
ncbi:hypothetical protein [Nocardia brasiliensis]|uniref:hypothetical protein n=1 Tax=Nocardia brasiliensis TaxID=37326 RepID=UPI0024558680|nr:hypothetical protein [Nocardia brasiliensis]